MDRSCSRADGGQEGHQKQARQDGALYRRSCLPTLATPPAAVSGLQFPPLARPARARPEIPGSEHFSCLPSRAFQSLDEYLEYLRGNMQLATFDVELTGGAQFRRLMSEVEVFLRFSEISAQTKKRDVIQACWRARARDGALCACVRAPAADWQRRRMRSVGGSTTGGVRRADRANRPPAQWRAVDRPRGWLHTAPRSSGSTPHSELRLVAPSPVRPADVRPSLRGF